MSTIFASKPPTLKYDSWSDFKKFLDGTFSSLTFSWSDKVGVYTIITEEVGGISKEITLVQDNGADHLDFEDNFKNLPPRKPGTYSAYTGDGYITIQGKVGGIAVPISASTLPLPTGAASESTLATLLTSSTFTSRINTLGQKTMANSTPVVIASDQSAISITGSATVSGTVTSNQGTAAALSGGWPVKITDGTNSVPLTNAAPVGNEQALVVRNIPSGTQTVSGSVSATISGTVTANQGTAQSLSNPWPVQLSNGTVTPIITNTTPGGSDQALVVRNIPSGTQTISGTVTANAGTGTFAISATSLPLPTGAATETTLATLLTSSTFTGRINTLGQKTMANSTPVVLASDQSTLTVSGTVTANAGTGNFTVVQATAANLNAQVVGPGASGSAVSGNPVRVAGSDGTNTRNILTDTSGRLVAVGSAASGAAVSGNPVLIAGSDGANARTLRSETDGTLIVKERRSSGSSITSVTSSASNVTLLAANANRLGATIYNDSNKKLYIKLGATASTTSFTVKLNTDDYYEVPFGYVGIIDGIWESANGFARVTEIT